MSEVPSRAALRRARRVCITRFCLAVKHQFRYNQETEMCSSDASTLAVVRSVVARIVRSAMPWFGTLRRFSPQKSERRAGNTACTNSCLAPPRVRLDCGAPCGTDGAKVSVDVMTVRPK